MPITPGSAQVNGAPLLLTALVIGAAQLLHTAPVGTATPNLISLFAFNSSDAAVLVTIALYDSGAALIRSFSKLVNAKAFMQPLLDDGDVEAEFILNGTIAIKAFADTASVVSLTARVNDQA